MCMIAYYGCSLKIASECNSQRKALEKSREYWIFLHVSNWEKVAESNLCEDVCLSGYVRNMPGTVQALM